MYWKATNASKKWQLLAYDAIIKSKLLYGLETAQVSKAELNRIDAFQIRGIRQILGKSTHTGTEEPRTMYSLTWPAESLARATKTQKGNKTQWTGADSKERETADTQRNHRGN